MVEPAPEAGEETGPKSPDLETLFKIYALHVEMSDRVSQRRQAANNFYLSVNTALIGGSAFLTSSTVSRGLWVLGIAGIAICALWVRNIVSYKTLNDAKFKVIHGLEEQLPAHPYIEEWAHLDPKKTGTRHKAFHSTEVLVPFVFMAVHAVQAAYNIPWRWLFHLFCAIQATHTITS